MQSAENPADRHNTCNLALYHLVAGNAAEAQRLYEILLDGTTSAALLSEAREDLMDLLRLFPRHSQAQAILEMFPRKPV